MFHRYSYYIVELCKKRNVGTIVIGLNQQWKTEVNLGDKTNQNFVYIAHSSLISKIKYKASMVGIDVIVNEESYTSLSSFIDNDLLPKYNKGNNSKHVFSGKRVCRGLYISKEGKPRIC